LLAACAVTKAPTQQPGLISPTPADLAVITWNMHAGRGDLSRLLSDLTAGRLTGSRPSAFVLMLQEAVDRNGNPPSTVDRLRPFGVTTYFVPVRDIGGRPHGNAIVTSAALVDRGVIPLPRERQPRSAAIAHIEVAGPVRGECPPREPGELAARRRARGSRAAPPGGRSRGRPAAE
jgi:endonuclease/exonuclease/phosphatase family metal-dependent hydrolase